MRVRQYLAELEEDEQHLVNCLSVELQDPRRARGYPNSVFRTWRLSFEQIQKQEPRAAEMVSLMTMLGAQHISI